MQTVDVIRRFSKTPLKHRMSKYVLEHILSNEYLLRRLVFVDSPRSALNVMTVAQAGAEGPAFRLELGIRERQEVSLVNGRLIKQTKRERVSLVEDPMQAIQELQYLKSRLHLRFCFSGALPDWYRQILIPQFSKEVSSATEPEQDRKIELALQAILLKEEIDDALRRRDRNLFYKKAPLYRQISELCSDRG